MALNLSKLPDWAKLTVSTLSIIALSGIVGNRADAIFLNILSLLSQRITVSLWVAMSVLLITIFSLIVILRYYYKAHQIATKINKLDESLLLLQPKLHVNSDITEALKRLLDEFLSRTLDLLHYLDGCGIAVYAPDPNDPEYLTTLCQLESPNEVKEKARFYIGNDSHKKRGVAGNTFIDQTRRIVHLYRKNGIWHSDNPDYIFLQDNRNRRRLSYRTLIAIPIIGDANNSLGVLCLYSDCVSAFDSRAVQDLLTAIALRLSAPMLTVRTYQMQSIPSTT
ncbi:GAF domain-containing protein [Fischerella sp. PCC 9605]|uniref:GAF domain-containing protein n=1 Tax=Fischerella sp. PCC 9605 TaxID=1173024 RepID=UPI00047CC96D|nr:GAF domain-containing protein [Fischerella sp. PCC 9605]